MEKIIYNEIERVRQQYIQAISLIESKYKNKSKKEMYYFIALTGCIFPAVFISFNEFFWGFQSGKILGALIYSPFFYFWFIGRKAAKEERIIKLKLKKLNF